jgi:hypothetical protein
MGHPFQGLGGTMSRKVAVGSGAEYIDQPEIAGRRHGSLDEQVHRLGLRPVMSLEDVARDDVFESDEELDVRRVSRSACGLCPGQTDGLDFFGVGSSAGGSTGVFG